MSKFRPEERSYFQTGVSGYIGSGNNQLVYTKRSAPSFARIRQVYGENLENYRHHELPPAEKKKLSEELKKKIRNEMRREIRIRVRNRIIALSISLLVLAGLVFFLSKTIFHIFPTLK